MNNLSAWSCILLVTFIICIDSWNHEQHIPKSSTNSFSCLFLCLQRYGLNVLKARKIIQLPPPCSGCTPGLMVNLYIIISAVEDSIDDTFGYRAITIITIKYML